MSEHLDIHELELFMDHKLAPNDVLRVATHIGTCLSCREQISHAKRTGARIDELRVELRRDAQAVEPHLDYERLEAYVDETIAVAEREVVGRHLAVCAFCAREAQDLKSFREDLLNPNNASNRAASLAASYSAGSFLVHLWQRLRDSLAMSRRIAWAAAALLITIALAGLLLLLWPRGKAPEITNNNSSNTPEVVKNSNDKRPDFGNQANAIDNSGDNLNANIPGGDNAPYAAVIKRALETQRIDPAPVLMELVGRPSTLMGKSRGETFNLLQPVGTVTLSNRPIFQWQPLNGATSYQVHVLDTAFKVVVESGSITATSWSPPTALERGFVYLWQVSAVKDGEVVSAPSAPRPEARFKVLSGSKMREVQRAGKAQRDSPLALGIIYAHNGLLDAAEQEFQNALNRTQESVTARKLLRDLSALRH